MSPRSLLAPLSLLIPLVAATSCEVAPPAGEAPYMAYAPGYTTVNGVVQPVNDLPHPYRTIRTWGTLPDGRSWGSVSAIEVDPDGMHVWAADRCGTNSCAGSDLDPIVKFDSDGNAVTSFGGGIIQWPHGMHIDDDGNIWVTDARGSEDGTSGQAVYKFSPEGEILLTLGTPGMRGDGTGPLLAEPNDVITAPNGDIFVAEAHGGQGQEVPDEDTVARIAKFSADGTYLTSFGSFGMGPGEFRTPHSLAFDSQGRLFVADRGNMRIQIFDQEGNFLEEWPQFSRISGLVITDDDVLYAIDSESTDSSNPGWRRGLRVGSARTGDVWYFVPAHMSTNAFGTMGEGVAVDAEGNVYAGEVGAIQGVTKFVPELFAVQH